MQETVEDVARLFVINGDPVVDHVDGGMGAAFAGVDLDDLGRLRRHMTAGTVLLQKPGICRPVPMIVNVRIMTGGAVHLAHPEAFAGSQQRKLIAMDVGPVGSHVSGHRKMRKRIAGPEREQGPQLDIVAARMANRASVDLLRAGKVLL